MTLPSALCWRKWLSVRVCPFKHLIKPYEPPPPTPLPLYQAKYLGGEERDTIDPPPLPS